MTRAFLALRLAEPATREISRVAARLAEAFYARTTHPEDLHVTLKFLGEIDETSVGAPLFDLAVQSMARIPTELTLDAITAFPDERRAAVLVFEATRVPPPLTLLVSDIDRAAEALGVAPERRAYRPHVTLLRLRPPRAVQTHLPSLVVAEIRALALCATLPPGSPHHYANLREAAIGAPRATTS